MEIVNNGTKKIVLCFSFLIFTSLISAYIMFLLGNRFFLLPDYNFNIPFFNDAIQIILFSINMFFVLSICMDIYSKKIFLHLFIVMIMYCIAVFVCDLLDWNLLFASSAIPIIYVMLFSINSENRKYKIKRTLIICSIMAIYQPLSLYIKCGVFNLGDVNSLSSLGHILYSIDLFIVYLLVYLYKGGDDNALASKLSLGSEAFDTSEHLNAEEQKEFDGLMTEYKYYPSWKKARTIILLFAIQILQLFVILGICAIGNKFVVSLVLAPAFLLFSIVIKKRWHSESVVVCTFVSASLFYIAACFTIPLKYSLFAVFLSAFFLVYALYRIAAYTEAYESMEVKLIEISKRLPFR
ncbi:MAG: hypothetical protein FWG61_00055, partial [Firmicutes bacterium]|nr:hypothetical protein [Bacillota bacterium]